MLCVSLIATATEEFYKETRKTIKVSNTVELDLDISYADINIQTWEQAQMEIVVKLNVNAKTQQRANEIFESITVNISESESLVGLDVSMGNYSCSGWSGESYTVTVDVKMPTAGMLDGKVAFGDAHLGEMHGACELRVEYGSLKASWLKASNNDVEIAFGDANIQTTGGGDFSNEYGELNIKKLTGSAEIKSAFGDLEIDLVTTEVKSLDIHIEYGDAEIDLASDASFTFDVRSSYSEVDLPDSAKNTTNEADYTTKHVTGTIGGGGNNKIKIECDFGDVDIDVL
ncbi:MAG: DUF4097 family beta strand repeat-containing protein [Flavobacteriales bacterium]